MKLLSSFKKEMILATRSFYFYIEIMFALVLLAVLLFAIPEQASAAQTEYIYLDMPRQAEEYFVGEALKEDLDGEYEDVAIEAGGETFEARLVETGERNVYLMGSEHAVRTLADTQMNIGAVISMDEDGELSYKYFLQGYESERLKNLVSVIHNVSEQEMDKAMAAQQVRVLTEGFETLNDKENAVPPLLAFNSSLMGMFIIAAYVFLDKKEGVINAFAVTASSVSRYLLSKAFVLLLTSVISGLVILIPVMGLKANYWLAVPLLVTSGFFASVVGLLIASFYNDIAKSFGVIIFVLVLMIVPSISYFMPGWNPAWINIIPSAPLMQGFKESILAGGDAVYALLVSAGFLAAGMALFFAANVRFRKSLSI